MELTIEKPAEKRRAYQRDWKRNRYHKDPEYRERLKTKAKLNSKKRNKTKVAAYSIKYRSKIRAEVIAAYGGECVCCGEREEAFLTIDHIHDDGAKHRKQMPWSSSIYRWLYSNGFPKEDFQLLCMNCQFGKQKLGLCPHKK